MKDAKKEVLKALLSKMRGLMAGGEEKVSEGEYAPGESPEEEAEGEAKRQAVPPRGGETRKGSKLGVMSKPMSGMDVPSGEEEEGEEEEDNVPEERESIEDELHESTEQQMKEAMMGEELHPEMIKEFFKKSGKRPSAKGTMMIAKMEAKSAPKGKSYKKG